MATTRTDVAAEWGRSAGERLAALRAPRGSVGVGGAQARRDGGGRPATPRSKPSPTSPPAGTVPPTDSGPPAGTASPADSAPPADGSGPAATAPLPVFRGPPPRPLVRLLERWVPSAWRGARLDPGRPGAIALVLVAVAAAGLASVAVWRSRPVAEHPPPLPLAGAVVESAPAPAARSPATGQPLVVSVAGKVHRPGLVRLPDGSRVADAIAQAGGPLRDADLTTLNLARRLTDGEHVLVGVSQPVDPPGAGPPAGGGGPPAPGGKVDLNRATLEQLDSLPGIGPVTAQRILDWRTKHGRFSSVEQLREVEGIGERRFGQLRTQVTI